MIRKRFTWKTEKLQHLDDEVIMVVDNANKDWKGHILNIVDMLNELSDDNRQLKKLLKGNNEKFGKCWDRIYSLEKENEQLRKYNRQLKERLEKINGGYGHLTYRNGLTANEWLIESQERELKKKKEQISDWIEQHSKDIAKIGEQQAIIEGLKEKLCELGVSDVKINGKRMKTGLEEWLE